MKIAIILISETSLAMAQTLQKELLLSEIFSTSQVVSEQGCRYIDSIQMFVSEALPITMHLSLSVQWAFASGQSLPVLKTSIPIRQ